MLINKNTKYSIGDEVFMMSENAVQKSRVIGVIVQVNEEVKDNKPVTEEHLMYVVKPEKPGGAQYYHEERLFASKGELLASL